MKRFIIWLLVLLAVFLISNPAYATDPQTGIASHYGPGGGVATQWCTWVKRHAEGCGSLSITSHQTGITVTAPVIDWCQCYRHTPDERIVDLQWGIVRALGLDLSQGLYPVTTHRIKQLHSVPDTAMEVRDDR